VIANGTTWVGMDAHQDSTKVAALLPEPVEPVEWRRVAARSKQVP
jgi:hypothetical protein